MPSPPPGPPSPDHATEKVHQRTWRRFETGYRMRPPVTVGLVLSFTLLHLATGLHDAQLGTAGRWGLVGVRSARTLSDFGGRVARLVEDGQLWRLWTYGFLHADGVHFLLNTVAMVGLGRVSEAVYGSTRTLWLFLLAVITGGITSQLGGNPASVGASGGLFGIMTALVVYGYRHRAVMDEEMRATFTRRLWPWVVFNLAIGFVIPSIDNLAHVGGLLGGLGFGLVSGNVLTANADASPLATRAMQLVAAGLLVGGTAAVITGFP